MQLVILGIAVSISTILAANLGVNIALNKTAYQSSTYKNHNGFSFSAEKAVDGVNSNYLDDGYCSHTNYNDKIYPWWVVDLGESYDVAEVVITNRGDCCGERLKDIWIGVSDSFNTANGDFNKNDFKTCQKWNGASKTGATVPVRCIKSVNGRYLAITVSSYFLQLCEVEVYSNPSNMALHKKTVQSSLYADFDSSKAVDGNRNSRFDDRSCTHTGHESEPWWTVDIGERYTVSEIVIWNRGDCCGERLHNVTVLTAKNFDERSNQNRFSVCVEDTRVGQTGEVVRIKATNKVNSFGRFWRVRISNSGSDSQINTLSLCEVEIYGLPNNMALGRKAYQSSTLVKDGASLGAGLAVDGDSDSQLEHKSCSSTNTTDGDSWWLVDLGYKSPIAEVIIKTAKRNSPSNVNIGVTDTFSNSGAKPTGVVQCTFVSETTGRIISLKTSGSCKGRYLVITSGSNEFSLCEVEAYSNLKQGHIHSDFKWTITNADKAN